MLCRLCGEDREDSWHIFQHCPALLPTRLAALGPEGGDDGDWTRDVVLLFVEHELVRPLLNCREGGEGQGGEEEEDDVAPI